MRYLRIIPARAGSRLTVCHRKAQKRDHPRACGEQAREHVNVTHFKGSSPRVRGAESSAYSRKCRRGIIPARAGSRTRRAHRGTGCRDHPRACGEQISVNEVSRSVSGSSPRVRGADKDVPHGLHLLGIIPARAGSSPVGLVEYLDDWDHPRACGEQQQHPQEALQVAGSSPRVRGADLNQ